MGEVGLLNPGERTELLSGQITLMAPRETPNVTSLHLLALRAQFGETALVRTQDPIQLDDFSDPDLTVVNRTMLDYAEQHLRPDQVYLVVEVADSTLRHDCEVKDKLYAQAGIADYWLVDLKNSQLHIFREPISTGYTRHLILTEPNQVSPLAFPRIIISLSEVLPPVV